MSSYKPKTSFFFNLRRKSSGRGITFDLCLTGMMLALVLLFQYLQRFTPWLSISFKLNFSIIFVLITWFVTGWPWMIILLLTRFLIGPALSQFGYSSISIFGNFVLLFSDFTFICFTVAAYFLCSWTLRHIRSQSLFVLLVFFVASALTSIFLTLMNGLWMTPVFWWLYGVLAHPGYGFTVNQYENNEKLRGLLLGVPSYWGGITLIYGTGNLVKFCSISLTIVPILVALKPLYVPDTKWK